MKKYVFLLVLMVLVSALIADGVPEGSHLFKVRMELNNREDITGYIEVFPWWGDGGPEKYSESWVETGEDITNKVFYNSSPNENPEDLLAVNTRLVKWRYEVFNIMDDIRFVKFKDIKKITALQDMTKGNGIYVNDGAGLSQAEADLMTQGVFAYITASGSESYGQSLLISCNPQIKQPELYIFTCMMNDEHNFNQENHPFLTNDAESQLGIELEQIAINDDNFNNQKISSILTRCAKTWKKMAQDIRKNDDILPASRDAAIDTLIALSESCKRLAKDLSAKVPLDLRLREFESNSDLYLQLKNAIYPRIILKHTIDFDQWKAYLLKHKVIYIEFAGDT